MKPDFGHAETVALRMAGFPGSLHEAAGSTPSSSATDFDICALSRRIPENAIVTADSGSSTNWYARNLRIRREIRGSLSGTLATMGPDVPYAIGAKLPAVDCLQIDVTRCGGYTEWRRATALAAAANRDVSVHCAPNVSAHAAVATPNFRHIEWFADHDRIETLFFDGSLDPAGGTVTPEMSAPGHGLSLRSDAAVDAL